MQQIMIPAAAPGTCSAPSKPEPPLGHHLHLLGGSAVRTRLQCPGQGAEPGRTPGTFLGWVAQPFTWQLWQCGEGFVFVPGAPVGMQSPEHPSAPCPLSLCLSWTQALVWGHAAVLAWLQALLWNRLPCLLSADNKISCDVLMSPSACDNCRGAELLTGWRGWPQRWGLRVRTSRSCQDSAL